MGPGGPVSDFRGVGRGNESLVDSCEPLNCLKWRGSLMLLGSDVGGDKVVMVTMLLVGRGNPAPRNPGGAERTPNPLPQEAYRAFLG